MQSTQLYPRMTTPRWDDYNDETKIRDCDLCTSSKEEWKRKDEEKKGMESGAKVA